MIDELDWRVLRELLELRARFRDMLERALLRSSPGLPAASPSFEPPGDVWESEGEVVVEVELPGARAGDVEVRLEGSELLISGDLTREPAEGGQFLRVERSRGPFHRRVPLPADVGGEPRATLHAGVLEVRLQRAERGGGRIAVRKGTP